MPTIISSEYSIGHLQEDGRTYVKEHHLLNDGRSLDFEYLSDLQVDSNLVMRERANRITAELLQRETSITESENGELPLTHNDFRKRLSIEEQLIFDNFNIPEFAESHPKILALSALQRAYVRTGLATYRDALDIKLSDADTQRLVGMFAAFGLLDNADRVSEILNG